LTLSIVATGSGLRNATDSALSADRTASTVTVKVKMALSRNVHECIVPGAHERAGSVQGGHCTHGKRPDFSFVVTIEWSKRELCRWRKALTPP